MIIRPSPRRELFLCAVLIGTSLTACGSGIGTPARVVLYEERQQSSAEIEPRIIARDRVNRPQSTTNRPRIVVRDGTQRQQIAKPGTAAPDHRPAPAAAPSRGEITRIELPPPQAVPSGAQAEQRAVDTVTFAEVPKDGLHTVRSGDTVYAVSRGYGVPVRAIIRANNLNPPYQLNVGQRIRIPSPRVHRVERGDTAYGISREYGVAMNELVRMNEIEPPYVVVPGQVLLLPGEVENRTDNTTVADAGAESPLSAGPERRQTAALQPPAAPPSPAEIPRPAPRMGKGFLWPVRGSVVSGFGAKGKGLHNDGINIQAPRGAPVRAAENGVVVYIGNELRGYGNLVLIKHADGYMTAYGHNDSVLVSRGQKVRRGETIARVGSTGNVETPQLHFEIRKARRAVDPVRYLAVQS